MTFRRYSTTEQDHLQRTSLRAVAGTAIFSILSGCSRNDPRTNARLAAAALPAPDAVPAGSSRPAQPARRIVSFALYWHLRGELDPEPLICFDFETMAERVAT